MKRGSTRAWLCVLSVCNVACATIIGSMGEPQTMLMPSKNISEHKASSQTRRHTVVHVRVYTADGWGTQPQTVMRGHR